MANRGQKINSHKGVAWRYVPTADNPADLASRGGHVEKADLWWDGPRWLVSPELWLADVLNKPSEESQTEAKLVQKVMGAAVNEESEVEERSATQVSVTESCTYLCVDVEILTQLSS